MSDDDRRANLRVVGESSEVAAPLDDQSSGAETTRSRGPRTTLVLTAVWAALAGAGLYAGNSISLAGLLVAVAVVQFVMVMGWIVGGVMPGRIGGVLLGVGAAAGADVALYRWHEHGYSPVLAVFGLAIPAMFIHQLTRGVVRTRTVESLAGIMLLIVAVVALSGLVLLRQQTTGATLVSAAVLAGAGGLVVSCLVDALWARPRFDPAVDRGLVAVVLAVAAGTGVGVARLHNQVQFAGGHAALAGAAIAAVAGLLAVGATFVEVQFAADPAAGPRTSALRPLVTATLVLCLVTPAAYVVLTALAK